MFPRRVRGRGRLVTAGGPVPIFMAALITSLFASSAAGSGTPTFSRTSTAFVHDNENLMKPALVNEARFSGARRVRNLATFSQNPENVAWTKAAMTVDVGAIAAPDGTLTGAFLNETATTATHAVRPADFSSVAGDSVVYSIYVKQKPGSRRYVGIILTPTFGNMGAVLDFDTGMVAEWGVTPSLAKGATAVGDGWWRLWVLAGNGTGGSSGQAFVYSSIDGIFANRSFAGVVGNGVYIWGAQLELVNGQSVQTPSEYVSTNVLSTPFQGANVDGVQYYDTVRLHTQNLSIYSDNMQGGSGWQTGGTGAITGPNTAVFPANLDYVGSTQGHYAPRIGDQMGGAVLLSGTGTVTAVVVRIAGGSYEQSAPLVMNLTSTPTWFTLNPLICSQDHAGSVIRITRDVTDTATGVTWHAVLHTRIGVQSILTGPENYNATGATPNLGTDTGATAPIDAATTAGLFREQGATNLCFQSQTLNNASWLKTDVTVTADQIPAPDGTLTADLCTEGVAGTATLNNNTSVIAANTSYCASIYLKRTGTGRWYRVRLLGAGADGVQVWFDLQTGAIGTTALLGAGSAPFAGIEPLPGGWFRVFVGCVVDAVSVMGQLQVISATADNSATRVNNAAYYAWGGQVEITANGQGPSSYVATTTVAVTRSTDNHSWPAGTNFDVTTGTLFAEYNFHAKTPPNTIMFGLAGLSAWPHFYEGTRAFAGYDGANFSTVPGTLAVRTPYKCCYVWGASTARSARTGGAAATNAFNNTFTGTPTGLAVGQFYGCVKNLQVYRQKFNPTKQDAMVA